MMKFKLDDEVTSKKLGPPMVGKVVAILKPELLSIPESALTHWDSIVPTWREHPVYCIKYNRPQREITLEEFLEFNPQLEEVAEDEIYMLWQNNVPVVQRSQYPEEDLERFE